MNHGRPFHLKKRLDEIPVAPDPTRDLEGFTLALRHRGTEIPPALARHHATDVWPRSVVNKAVTLDVYHRCNGTGPIQRKLVLTLDGGARLVSPRF